MREEDGKLAAARAAGNPGCSGQELVREKDGELAGAHAATLNSNPGCNMQELVREKDGELAAARARRRALLPMVAAAAGAAERRVSQEVPASLVA